MLIKAQDQEVNGDNLGCLFDLLLNNSMLNVVIRELPQ